MRLELGTQRNPFSGILQVIQVPGLAEVKKREGQRKWEWGAEERQQDRDRW